MPHPGVGRRAADPPCSGQISNAIRDPTPHVGCDPGTPQPGHVGPLPRPVPAFRLRAQPRAPPPPPGAQNGGAPGPKWRRTPPHPPHNRHLKGDAAQGLAVSGEVEKDHVVGHGDGGRQRPELLSGGWRRAAEGRTADPSPYIAAPRPPPTNGRQRHPGVIPHGANGQSGRRDSMGDGMGRDPGRLRAEEKERAGGDGGGRGVGCSMAPWAFISAEPS